MEEKWLVIKEVPDYEVSSAGRVRSLKRGSVRILKTFNNLQGYPMVSLCVKGKPNTRTVHRLVAAAHVPNDFGLLEVNHIDGDKSNNHSSNLEWCSRGYNISHSYKLGLRDSSGERQHRSILKEADVSNIKKLRKEGFKLREIADRYGVHLTTINAVLTGRSWRMNVQ